MYPTESELRRIKKLPRGKQTEHFIYHLLLPKILGYWTFHGPKHAGKELADILVWWEDVVLLLEAKTKDTPDYPKKSWIREKLRDAIESINDRADMLRRGEVDALRNKWRGEVKWDPGGVKDYIGVVILHHNFDHDNPNRYDPTEIAQEAFKASKVPIAVISLHDFVELVRYENTVWDLITYFEARFQLWRRQRLLVLDEFEIYQTVWSYWPELTAGHCTEEQARKVQEYQMLISNTIMRSSIAIEQGYADLAASRLLDYCLRVMIIKADRDESGKPVSSREHSFLIKAIGALSEITRLRRTEYGRRWLQVAQEATGTSNSVRRASRSPSRNRAYVFVAFGEGWSRPIEPYLAEIASEEQRKRNTDSCLCLGARAIEVITAYEALLTRVKKEDTLDEPLSFAYAFVESNKS